MRRAGAFWQAFVQAQARGEPAPVLPRRSSAPFEDAPRMRDRQIPGVVAQEKVETIDDR
jgi:hypothetical protein